MERRAYVVAARWPRKSLTCVGKLTSCYTCGQINHVGIYIPHCTDDEIDAHSNPAISHKSARGAKHITFDFLYQKLPKFQSVYNKDYWSADCKIVCYPIMNVTAARVHEVCVCVAFERPYNNTLFRVNRLVCCGLLPCHIIPSNSAMIAQSHCGVLSMRIMAAAKSGTNEPLKSDDLTRLMLNIPEQKFLGLYFRVLTSYTPGELVKLMREARAIGNPEGTFPGINFRGEKKITSDKTPLMDRRLHAFAFQRASARLRAVMPAKRVAHRLDRNCRL